MKKTFNYLAITSCLLLGATLAHADTDKNHGKMYGEMKEKMFKAMDSNSDGKVTMEEFNEAHAKKFKEMDINGNGEITLEEMNAECKKMMGDAGCKKMDHAKDKKMDSHHSKDDKK